MKEYTLRDVLIRQKEAITVEDDAEYKRITIKMNGNGVLLRDEVIGDAIGTKRQFLVSSDQFVLSKIDARNGAFGIVPKSCDGAIITGNFWTFDVNSELADVKYLDFMSKTPEFKDFCIVASEGTTNRKYLDENKFLDKRILLPELAEQKKVVAKILKFKNKIELARKIRNEILSDLYVLLNSTFHKLIEGAVYKPMSEVAPIVRRQIEITVDGEYPELGARSFGKGIFHKPTLIGAELDWQKLYTVHSGDLVLSNIKAWEGAIAAAGDNDHGRVGSHRYITCVPVEGVTTANFLAFYLLTQEGIEQVQAASPGSADRNRTLAMKRLEKIKVPVPDYDKQLWFNQLQSYVEKIKQAQSENEIELEALMPSILDKAFKGELV
ncbi:restriction endonuclease subunit S [Escherichia coli]|uniref:Type I restriction-modification enzyme, specificity subunit n=2 Tax=Gammaproteobacteria TaxID=1236 RepID=L0BD84_VIBFL|nr:MULTISPECIES: restriction endonuclease subunit S [Gammaproteobacteria]AFZ85165.1 type I restriction-modification enzyme, specificity subunit [Vibrio fluvialis]AVK35721.1 type I restriction modification DNA specificity domain protein [Morganella morganii]EAC2098970.1 restriction endonuclease subunit S [Escherichia coli]EEW1010718.1 restriction endonuclease subunit S [Escherichia coli]EFO5067676.1 restriction endonuclease subunit S [Escherichia coli]